MGIFHEVRLPDKLSYNSGGGPFFAVDIVNDEVGREHRIDRWRYPERRYTVTFQDRSPADIYEIAEFFLARRGGEAGFRFKDWHDYSTAPDGVSEPGFEDQTLEHVSGNVWQLVKVYTNGPFTHRRVLTKIVPGTVKIKADGVELQEGVNALVNYNNGRVTLPGGGEVVTGGCEFDVPVAFAPETDQALDEMISDFGKMSTGVIRLVELKDMGVTLSTSTETVPGWSSGNGGGGGPGGVPGCPTCGGGLDPDPDYENNDPGVKDPPPDPETYSCKKCGDCCFSDNSTFTVTSEWPEMGYTELASDFVKDWVDAYNAVRTSVPPLPFDSASNNSVVWKWTAPAVTGSRTGESIAPYFIAVYVCADKYWYLGATPGGMIESVRLSIPATVAAAQAGSTCTSANYEVDTWFFVTSIANRIFVTEPDVEGHLSNQWCENSGGSCVKLS